MPISTNTPFSLPPPIRCDNVRANRATITQMGNPLTVEMRVLARIMFAVQQGDMVRLPYGWTAPSQ